MEFSASAQWDSQQARGVALGPDILQGSNDRERVAQMMAFEVRQFLQMQVVVRLKATPHAKSLVGDAKAGHELESVTQVARTGLRQFAQLRCFFDAITGVDFEQAGLQGADAGQVDDGRDGMVFQVNRTGVRATVAAIKLAFSAIPWAESGKAMASGVTAPLVLTMDMFWPRSFLVSMLISFCQTPRL